MRKSKEIDELYNPERKEKYLNECNDANTTKTNIISTFHKSSTYETPHKKDVCEFTQEDVVAFIKENSTWKRKYINNIRHDLDKYCKWCLKQNIISDYDNKFSPENIHSIIKNNISKNNKEYFNSEDLATYLNDINEPENKFIFYSHFKGITFKELVNIKASDVDKESMTVKLIGRELEVDKRWIELMDSANNSKSYNSEATKNSSKSRPDLKVYGESDYVLKYTIRKKNKPLDKTTYSNRFRIVKKQTNNIFLDESTIKLNGLVSHIKKRLLEENGITLQTAFSKKNSYNEQSSYNKMTKDYIKEFGDKHEPNDLKHEITEYLDCFFTENELLLMNENITIKKEIEDSPDKYKEIIAKARIGQGKYREKLIERFCGKCAICDIKNENLLIASHIKAYAECNDGEQIDIDNGLLLCANHDKLFDKHLISFDTNGKIFISNKINEAEYKSLNISEKTELKIYSNSNKYLKEHFDITKS